MTKQLLFRLIAATLLPFLFAACDKTPQPPLVFGASTWPGYEPVYLARELGYFQGANLRLDEFGSAAATEQAFRDRKAHIAAITLDRALLLRRDIPELKIILLFDAESQESPASGTQGGPGRRMDVLVTRDDTIGVYHRELQQFLQGWRRAMEYIRDNREKAVQAMAQREHLTPAQFSAAQQGFELYDVQRNQQLMIGEPPPIGGAIEAAQRALLNQGKLQVGVDPSMLLDSTLLAEHKR